MTKDLPFLLIAALLGGCGMSCGNEISQSVTSPSGAIKAVVFNRGCGATVGFNTQVSILPAEKALPDDRGNLLIMDGSVALEIHWDSDGALRVSGMKQAKVFRQERSVNGIRIEYRR